MVHQLRATTRSGGSPRPGRSPTTPAPASATRPGSRPGPTAPCGSPTTGNSSIGRITTAGTVTNYTGPGISHPIGIAAGPDGALWFTNSEQRLDRADHHRRDGHQLHRAPASAARAGSRPGPTARCGSPTRATARSGGSPRPGRSPTTPAPASTSRPGSRPGPTAPCGSPTPRNGSIGRITTAGTVTNYTGPGISDPDGIAAGPDGALWFTNPGNDSIGRITTAGTVTNYTGPGISGPDRDRGRTRRGPVVHQPRAADSIGRITTAGTVTNYTGPGISRPDGIAAGPDGALWFTNCRATTARSGGSPPPGRSRTTPAPASAARAGSRPGPTAPCGSPIRATTRSGGSPPPGRSPTTPAPASAARTGSRPGPTAPCGSPTRARLDRADHHHREGHQLHGHRHQRPGRDHGRTRRRPVVHQQRQATRSGGSPPPGRSPTTPARHQQPAAGSRPDPTAPCGSPTSGTAERLDRADHHRREGHQLHRPRHQRPDRDRGRARRRPVVHRRGNDSIGRITTAVTPGIVGFSPRSGPVGTRVTIIGRNLSPVLRVGFHGTPATVVSHTASRIVVTVPAGATTGRITVTTRAGRAATNNPFEVT